MFETDSQSLNPSKLTLGTRITDHKGIEMVYVPAGKFRMGSTSEQIDELFTEVKRDYQDQLPQHEIQIAQPFWMDLTPVTNAAYAQFVSEGGYQTADFWVEDGLNWLYENKTTIPEDNEGFTDPQQPRVGVSWYEADAYARWRGGRLPTEAEWEWAARGPENRTYPWGDSFDATHIIFKNNSNGKTAAVGADIRILGASWVGALDMSGNVWEWVNSLYAPYPYRAEDGREFPNSTSIENSHRVVRGGSWYLGSAYARTAMRLNPPPHAANTTFGFRIVRPIA